MSDKPRFVNYEQRIPLDERFGRTRMRQVHRPRILNSQTTKQIRIEKVVEEDIWNLIILRRLLLSNVTNLAVVL